MTEKEESREVLVVSELPVQPYNLVEEDGKKFELLTIQQAITEIYKDVKEIRKSLG